MSDSTKAVIKRLVLTNTNELKNAPRLIVLFETTRVTCFAHLFIHSFSFFLSLSLSQLIRTAAVPCQSDRVHAFPLNLEIRYF